MSDLSTWIDDRGDPHFLDRVHSHQKLYFVHIPKTAGTFIRHGHFPEKPGRPEIEQFPDRWHLMAHRLNPAGPKFSVVRNPYDWLTSMYLHESGIPDERSWFRGHPAGVSHLGWHHSAKGCSNFGDYVEKLLDDQLSVSDPDPRGRKRPFSTGLGFNLFQGFSRTPFIQLLDPAGTVQVDFIIKQEFLAKGLAVILDVDERSILQLPRHNVTPAKEGTHYKEFYDPQLADLVRERWHHTFEEFGYDLDGPTDQFAVINTSKDCHLPV